MRHIELLDLMKDSGRNIDFPPILDHFSYYIFIGIHVINEDVRIENSRFPALPRHESKRLPRTNQSSHVAE